MFVTGITKRVDLPDGEWVEVRKLSGKQLETARKVRQREAAETAKAFGGDVLGAIRKAREEQADDIQTALADPLNDHDRWELLYAGVTGWSANRKVAKSAIDELDEETVELLAREILDLSGLTRQTDEEREAELGNA